MKKVLENGVDSSILRRSLRHPTTDLQTTTISEELINCSIMESLETSRYHSNHHQYDSLTRTFSQSGTILKDCHASGSRNLPVLDSLDNSFDFDDDSASIISEPHPPKHQEKSQIFKTPPSVPKRRDSLNSSSKSNHSSKKSSPARSRRNLKFSGPENSTHSTEHLYDTVDSFSVALENHLESEEFYNFDTSLYDAINEISK